MPFRKLITSFSQSATDRAIAIAEVAVLVLVGAMLACTMIIQQELRHEWRMNEERLATIDNTVTTWASERATRRSVMDTRLETLESGLDRITQELDVANHALNYGAKSKKATPAQ